MVLINRSLSLKFFILVPSLSIRHPYAKHTFCLMALLRPLMFCMQLNTLVSVHAWQTITKAFSACSDTKWLVSVAFFSNGCITVSIFGSKSRVGSSENTTCTVIQAFLATWDLKLSVCFTTFLIVSFWEVPVCTERRFLWNIATLLTTFKESNTFYQSSDFRLVWACLYWLSGLCSGSSGVV